MTTIYNFKGFFTKNGSGFNPTPPPTISIDDGTNILVGNAVTFPAALTGEYRFSYSGIDNLILGAVFNTTDNTVDKTNIFSEPNVISPDNADIALIKAKTDQITFTVTGQIDSNVLDWKSLPAPEITFQQMTFDGDYFIGDTVRTSFGFRNLSGNFADPTAVELDIKNPNGIITTYIYGVDAIVKDSVGNYHFDIVDVQITGQWINFWKGTGTVQDSGASTFNVLDPFALPAQVPLWKDLDNQNLDIN